MQRGDQVHPRCVERYVSKACFGDAGAHGDMASPEQRSNHAVESLEFILRDWKRCRVARGKCEAPHVVSQLVEAICTFYLQEPLEPRLQLFRAHSASRPADGSRGAGGFQ